MKRGIVLIAVGEPTYIRWAYNQALTIKFYSDIKIQLITEKRLFSSLDAFQKSRFDIVTYLKEEEVYDIRKERHKTVKKLKPGRVKIEMYDRLAFDENIYLDVDGFTIKDIEPLFDLCKNDYYAQYQGEGGYQERPWADMIWAKPDVVFDTYKLPKDTIIPFINSSFQFIRKGKVCKELYKKAKKNLDNAPALKDLHYPWGGVIPDELVMNVTLAQLKINPTLKKMRNPLYFSIYNRLTKDAKDVVPNYYGVGLLGDRKINHIKIRN